MPGQSATFGNYSSYADGINGIFVDLFGDTSASITASDFEFTVGNSSTPGTGSSPGSGWETLLALPTITALPGQGIGGSDRLALTWPAGAAIMGPWLQITVLADSNTGLSAPGRLLLRQRPRRYGQQRDRCARERDG